MVEPTATQETEEGSFIPTPTLPPLLDADLSLIFDTTGVAAVDGEQLTIEFTVTNVAPVSASVASVAFDVHEPSTLVMAESDRGSCEGPACVPLAWYPRLVYATPQERSNWELIGGWQGIHWPDLDEDISIEGLLAGRKSGESHRSFRQWLEAKREGRGLTLNELTD